LDNTVCMGMQCDDCRK